MHVKRGEIDEWIKKLDDRGIKEFQFKDLPDDLKHRRALQKAKDLGLLKSVNITNGRHTWEVVPSNISTKSYKIQDNKKDAKNGVNNDAKMSEERDKKNKKEGIKNELGTCLCMERRVEKEGNNDI